MSTGSSFEVSYEKFNVEFAFKERLYKIKTEHGNNTKHVKHKYTVKTNEMHNSFFFL